MRKRPELCDPSGRSFTVAALSWNHGHHHPPLPNRPNRFRQSIEVLQILRQAPETRDLPVVVCSGSREPEVQAEAMDLGARDFLVKGAAGDEILRRIELAMEVQCAA